MSGRPLATFLRNRSRIVDRASAISSLQATARLLPPRRSIRLALALGQVEVRPNEPAGELRVVDVERESLDGAIVGRLDRHLQLLEQRGVGLGVVERLAGGVEPREAAFGDQERDR